MQKPKFKVGDRVITNRGRKTRIRKVEAAFLYQTDDVQRDDAYGEDELRKAKQRGRHI